MATVKEIYETLDELLPRSLSLSWDNDGLMVCPDPDTEVHTILFALDITDSVVEYAKEIGAEVEIYQSNYEGDLVTKIQQALGVFDGIVINPAAYTHTSVALLDALKAVAIPAVEVHISDVSKREGFRSISFVREYCFATIAGHGFAGYTEAIDLLLNMPEKRS